MSAADMLKLDLADMEAARSRADREIQRFLALPRECSPARISRAAGRLARAASRLSGAAAWVNESSAELADETP